MGKKKQTSIIDFLDREYRKVVEIKLKSKFRGLNEDDKIKVFESISKWCREQINDMHPEQD